MERLATDGGPEDRSDAPGPKALQLNETHAKPAIMDDCTKGRSGTIAQVTQWMRARAFVV
jgi:hypothetical protein